MKKRILSLILAAILAVALLAGCGGNGDQDTTTTTAAPAQTTAGDDDNGGDETDAPSGDSDFKVGITIQSLENSYWAGVFGEVENLIKAKG